MTELSQVARGINEEIASHSSIEAGKTLTHPDGRTVLIKSGCFLDSTYGRVSNFWYWNEVLSNGDLGPEEHGYGWRAP